MWRVSDGAPLLVDGQIRLRRSRALASPLMALLHLGLILGGVERESAVNRSIDSLCPDLASPENRLLRNADLVELVVIAASEEGALRRKDLKAPNLARMMRQVMQLERLVLEVKRGDPRVHVADENLTIKVVERVGGLLDVRLDLGKVFEFTLVDAVNRQFAILAAGDEHPLGAGDRGDLAAVGGQGEADLTALIPTVDETVLASTEAEAFLIERAAIEPSLLVLLPKRAALKQFLGGVRWMPKLQPSRRDRGKSQVVRFFRPLHIVYLLEAGGHLQNDLLLLNIEYGHDVLLTIIDAGNVAMARAECEGGHALGLGSKAELANALHGVSVPNVHHRHLPNFPRRHNVPRARANMNIRYIILVHLPRVHLPRRQFVFRNTSEELLFARGKGLDDANRGRFE